MYYRHNINQPRPSEVGVVNMDNEKLQEYAKYLRCCSNLELESFGLYRLLSSKMNNPESSFVLSIAYDSLKNSKIVQSLLEALDQSKAENKNCGKNLSKLFEEIQEFSKYLSKIRNIENDRLCEILKELVNLEELLGLVYTNFQQSTGPQLITDELSKSATTDLNNFKKIFDSFVENKTKHRETLVEIIYYFETRETTKTKYLTPTVKYQNPDAWINQTSLHVFSTSIKREENAA
jgi:hypothetical protein